ncbi:hypothetical protein XENOCAPTIV_002951 [Xenoophorus captivus]|uniref:Uncharacterized protein n=1 Tax=Xenoophorus captivus TaxID=1517983 RepID=A0ABV0QPJ8_9TELE
MTPGCTESSSTSRRPPSPVECSTRSNQRRMLMGRLVRGDVSKGFIPPIASAVLDLLGKHGELLPRQALGNVDIPPSWARPEAVIIHCEPALEPGMAFYVPHAAFFTSCRCDRGV